MRKFAIGCSFFLCLLAGCATQNASAPPPLEVAREDEVTIQHEPKFESIVDTHVINDKYVLVQTQKETFAPKFQLWNKTTNQVDVLPTMPDIVELQHIISPEYFVFSATGRGSESSRLEFPHTVKCFKVEVENESFVRVDEEKRFDLSEDICAGSDISCELAAVNFSFDSVSFLFAPSPSSELPFYADAPDIPLTTITYEETTNMLHISLASCSIDNKNFVCCDTCLSQNPYIEEYRIEQNQNDTTIQLLLSSGTLAYYAEKDFSFEPFFVLRFSR